MIYESTPEFSDSSILFLLNPHSIVRKLPLSSRKCRKTSVSSETFELCIWRRIIQKISHDVLNVQMVMDYAQHNRQEIIMVYRDLELKAYDRVN